MEAGSFFGDLAALDGGPRSLSVFAVNDSLVAKMPCAVFVETVFTHRPLGEAVVAALTARRGGLHVVVTGRNAKPELVAAADLVTEMTLVKHHFAAGVKAQPGIEF